jgi:hypothetical protein
MQRNTLVALLSLSLLGASAATTAADDWKLMPVSDANYKPEMTLSGVVGSLNPEHVGSGGYTGVELAFNCLALQPPSGMIRSKISLGEFDHQGMKLTTFEVNPRWTTNLDKNLSVGFGPGIGLVKAEMAGGSANMAALQLGADLDYRIGALNLGLGARWQVTQNKEIVTGVRGADNFLIQAKVGMNF